MSVCFSRARPESAPPCEKRAAYLGGHSRKHVVPGRNRRERQRRQDWSTWEWIGSHVSSASGASLPLKVEHCMRVV